MILFFACLAKAPQVSPEVLAVAGAPPESEASLAVSRETFVTVCTECHLLPAPKWHSSDEWPDVVESMRKEHDAEFDDAQKADVLAYIDMAAAWHANTRAARKEK
jgi:hypothetical protein